MSLKKLREEVCQANRDLVRHGLVTLTWGNVSGLADDREVFAIKPSGVPYEELRPEQMVIVRVNSGEVVEGDLRPSSDTPTHRLLYQSFEGVGGVTHTHSPKATAWAQARRSIPCLRNHPRRPLPRRSAGHAPAERRQEVADAYEAEHRPDVIIEHFAEARPRSRFPECWWRGTPRSRGAPTRGKSLENAVALEAVSRPWRSTRSG